MSQLLLQMRKMSRKKYNHLTFIWVNDGCRITHGLWKKRFQTVYWQFVNYRKSYLFSVQPNKEIHRNSM